MTEVYFNECDSFAAQWLRNLYPKATVDARDIRQVDAAGLAGFRRCHFFGGIGGWEYALDLAGWGDAEVWTGSCPCQPFSVAGKRKAEADERHLWPAFLRLIAERRPATIFGEQVASKLGRVWLARVRTDLEALGYAVGAADLPAASVAAPHRRYRLFWVANSTSKRYGSSTGNDGPRTTISPWRGRQFTVRGPSPICAVGNPDKLAAWSGSVAIRRTDGAICRVSIEPELFPLAHGVPARVGRLRAYGNAIVPQVAAAFVRAFMEATEMVS